MPTFVLNSGIETKFKKQLYPVLIAPTHVPELNEIEVTSQGVRFGASVSLTDVEDTLKQLIKERPGDYLVSKIVHFLLDVFGFTLYILSVLLEKQTRVFVAVVEMLRWFAGHQVRNVAVSPDLSKVVKTSVASS